MLKRIVLFLVLNFFALAIGSVFTKAGVSSYWYQNLNKAPWTPPGWMFGVNWTVIMICFAIYMSFLFAKTNQPKSIWKLFIAQWFLNSFWNPVFFYFKQATLGLIVIFCLTYVIGLFLFKNYNRLKLLSLWITPYFIWLLIALSLNAYIVFMN